MQLEPSMSGGPHRPLNTLLSVSVLIVDDDVDTQSMLAVILEHAGYTVAACANGCEALSMLTIIRPSLILLDMEMPVMCGAEFRQKQRRDPELARIPTFVMTGTKSDTALDHGLAGVLQKPLPADELVALVSRYCPAA